MLWFLKHVRLLLLIYLMPLLCRNLFTIASKSSMLLFHLHPGWKSTCHFCTGHARKEPIVSNTIEWVTKFESNWTVVGNLYQKHTKSSATVKEKRKSCCQRTNVSMFLCPCQLSVDSLKGYQKHFIANITFF